MKKIVTDDGSVTVYHEELQETYHTKSGAKEEAIKKHCEALNIIEKKNQKTKILDICFGLGYNAVAALEKLDNTEIHCYENDLQILQEIEHIEIDFKHWKEVQKFIKGFLENSQTEYAFGRTKLVMHYGDFREQIMNMEADSVDYVFFDPFSPAKVPELWTLEVFKTIAKILKINGKISTYSCARKVRDNMKEAGLIVTDGPTIGRRSPSTIAIKQ